MRSIVDVLGKRRREKTKISSAITFDSKKGRTARITDFMPAPAQALAPRHSLPEAQVSLTCGSHSFCAAMAWTQTRPEVCLWHQQHWLGQDLLSGVTSMTSAGLDFMTAPAPLRSNIDLIFVQWPEKTPEVVI